MGVTGYFGQRKRRRQPPPAPRPAYSQAEQADRRRQYLSIVYDGGFSLSGELRSAADPLAQRIAAVREPARLTRAVENYIEALHEGVSTIVGWLGEDDGRKRTQHLADQPGRRRAAIRLIADLAQRPALPVLDPDALAAGSWPELLAEMAQPFDAGLADLLARSYPPDSPSLGARSSRSELLADLLRVSVDRPGVVLARVVDKAQHWAPIDRPRAASAAPKSADDIRAELAQLGVRL
ncbi:MAG: hypothetical protein K0U84_03465 [Actinomycetia bacterium]|nr:hypothetical protein [Actinomycetes bacterium]